VLRRPCDLERPAGIAPADVALVVRERRVMRKRSLLLAAFTACALLTVAAPMVASAEQDHLGKRGNGLDVIGLTADGRLIEFESDEPGDADTIGTIAGLVQDTRVVGIDYRPATGELIGLGDQGGVYAISDDNAARH
jgi:hypothetical protein